MADFTWRLALAVILADAKEQQSGQIKCPWVPRLFGCITRRWLNFPGPPLGPKPWSDARREHAFANRAVTEDLFTLNIARTQDSRLNEAPFPQFPSTARSSDILST
jgi:hypothetical protein